jgi:replication-associated recombination protein RarA
MTVHGVQLLAKIGTPEARKALTELLTLAKTNEAKEAVKKAIDEIDSAN